MIAPSVPMAPELKCVSGFCLPRGYKKLETPITEGKYRKSTTSHNSIPLLLLVSNHTTWVKCHFWFNPKMFWIHPEKNWTVQNHFKPTEGQRI